ncbi:uncharacterized protein CEXT_688471 [Caerostris extrusa]|uniref:Transcription factor IIIC 90kDa subunit N-terminal domain-containing protein n=1 Tax=Caerostris extrusa TaxID=172846 RepID=A0AAV4Y1M0_CAEEX|nr:uncharacterized protein CEXT_688471 [Caerostris extrusa]
MANIPIIQKLNLPGEICRKFALEWSPDNKLAICTSKTIYVLNSYCSPDEIGFPSKLHTQVIQAPKEPMQLNPVYIPSNPYRFVQTEEDRENLYNVLMDHTINPTPQERAECFCSFRSCKWSPKGATDTGKCLLATLTMDHRLQVYEENEKEWLCIWDLTDLLKKEIVLENHSQEAETKQKKGVSRKKKKRESKTRTRSKRKANVLDESDEDVEEEEEEEDLFNISESLNYEKLKNDIYKYAPMEITWTGMFGGLPSGLNDKSLEYCFLIVAMKSGHIQFWKISLNEGRVISLIREWDTELGLITSLSWQQTSSAAGFLMCGSLKGVLAFIPVAVVTNPDEEPQIAIQKMCKIWDEEDLVAVDHVVILKAALKKYICICSKMHALVGCEIVLSEDQIIIQNIGHSFGLHKLPITGMAVLDSRSIPQSRLLISTMEGKLIEVTITLGKEEITFQHDLIPIDLDLKHNMIQGLALSSNGLLCGLILNTAVYFDHLEKKQPLQFVTFVTRPVEEIYEKLKAILKPQVSFLPATTNTIINLIDYLDVIRLNLAMGISLPDWLTSFLDNDPATYKNHSSLELYFMRFILHAYVSGLAVAATKTKDNFVTSKIDAIEALIMCNYISKVFKNCQNLDLSLAQIQSLLVMADWLLKEFDMSIDSLYLALGYTKPDRKKPYQSEKLATFAKEMLNWIT